MAKLIILTDLHMLPEGGRIIGIDPDQRLASAIAHINANHADAAGVIITGDLTHHGDVVSYERLKARLADLVPPVHMTIGNHDKRDMFRQVFPEVAVDPNGFVQAVIDLGGHRLILVDTVHDLPADDPDHHAGYLSAARLAWLERQLHGAGTKPVVVFMHHPPHDTGFVAMDAIKLLNGEDFYAAVERHRNVRHLVAGHVHRTISGSHRGIPYAIFKSPVHQQPMPFATATTDISVDEPAAYGILVLTPAGVQVHTEDYEIAGAKPVVSSRGS